MSNKKPPAPVAPSAPAGLRPSALALAVLLATSVLPPAFAQTQPAPVRQAYAIAAGSLEEVLIRFSATAGLALSFEPALVEGLRSAGLNGSFGAEEGLHRVLQGSGLEAQARGANAYVLRKLPAATTGAVDLPAIRVEGKTEGTGSYTTGLTNTATKLNLSLRETPQSVTVMTHKRMEDQGLGEVSEVLEQTTGLYFNNTNVVGGDSNFVYSRGFELQNYQVGGVPRSSRFGFGNDISDTALFDRVEVVRGASGLLNGVGEPSGAVNLVRKLPTRDFQAHVAAKVGSWDFYRAEADLSGALNQGGSVRGRIVAVHQDNATYVDRVKMNKDVLYGVIEADLTPSTVLSAGVELQRHRTTGAGSMYSGAPIFFRNGLRTGFGPSTNLGADWSGTERDNQTLFAGLEHYFDNEWRLRLDVESSRRKYDIAVADATLHYANAGNVGSFRGFRWVGEPEQNSLNLHASGPFRLFGRTHELVVGGSYYQMREEGQNYTRMDTQITGYGELFGLIGSGYYPRGNVSPTGAGTTLHDWQSGLYAATRLNPADGVSVILGGRLSNWKTRTDRHSATGITTRGTVTEESSVLTPYAGVVVDLTDNLSAYASYTDIFQPAIRYDERGNLLDPAEGNNVEAGLKLELFDKRLNVSAAAYRTRKDKVPEYVPGLIGPNGEGVWKSVDGTKTTGFELDIAGELTRDWQVAGGFSYNKPVDAKGAPRLTHIPRKMFKLFTSYKPRALLPGLTLGANLRWQDSMWTTAPYPYAQGSATTLDLMAHYEITPQWSATLNLTNVADKRYYTNINGGGWYGEPRSASLNVRYAFK